MSDQPRPEDNKGNQEGRDSMGSVLASLTSGPRPERFTETIATKIAPSEAARLRRAVKVLSERDDVSKVTTSSLSRTLLMDGLVRLEEDLGLDGFDLTASA